MVLLVLKCHLAHWHKWHKLLIYMKGEFLYLLFIIMSINLQKGNCEIRNKRYIFILYENT